jgi:hypothetical protein
MEVRKCARLFSLSYPQGLPIQLYEQLCQPQATFVKIKSIIAAQLVLWGSLMPIHAQLLLNGSFETPSIPGTLNAPNLQIFDSEGSPTGIDGWLVTAGQITLINPGVGGIPGLLAPDDGSQYVALNGLTVSAGALQPGLAGAFEQPFSTTPGDLYNVQFSYAGLAAGVITGSPDFQVTVSNASQSTAPPGGLIPISANSWQVESFSFVATGSTSTLGFDATTGALGNLQGIGLDHVSVTPSPTPEPSSWSLLGLGLLALLTTRRIIPAAKYRSIPR